MSSATLIYKAPNTLQLTGELNFNSVIALQLLGAEYLQQQTINTIDLQHVERSNSAGLALLLEWQRLALQKECPLKFINMPANMQSAAKLYGVIELLMIERE